MQEDLHLKIDKYIKKQINTKLVLTLYENAVVRETADRKIAHLAAEYETGTDQLMDHNNKDEKENAPKATAMGRVRNGDMKQTKIRGS